MRNIIKECREYMRISGRNGFSLISTVVRWSFKISRFSSRREPDEIFSRCHITFAENNILFKGRHRSDQLYLIYSLDDHSFDEWEL